ncbi:MAG: ADOP family duplicated permease [Blastocatellia bacterium]
MTWWHRLWRRKKMEAELEKELRFHLEQHTADLIAQGLAPEEARRQARLVLGGPEQVKEMCRDVRGTRWLGDLAQDLRYAGRMWRQSPAFTLFAVCGLALAIGANTAVFTIVNAVLFRTPPISGIDRIGFVNSIDKAHGNEEPLQAFSYPDYRDLKERLKSFEDLAAYHYGGIDLSDDANFPERYSVVRMTANTLSVLGQKPLLGRDLEPADTQSGAPPVALLAHRVWESRYNKNESVIGKTVRIDGTPATIIGVTPPDARLYNDIALWLPLITPPSPSPREKRDLLVFGRLANGVNIGQASGEAVAVARQLEVEYPATNKNIGAEVQGANEFHTRAHIHQVGQALLGGVAFVLLIACANAANLLLGRAVIRSREMSIRAALGAGRLRVIRQLLTESVLLSIMAGLLGAFLAYWGVKAFDAALAAIGFVKSDYVVFSVDRNVLLHLSAISIGTGIVFGLAPALRMSKIDLSSALKEGGQGAGVGVRRRLLTNILVGAEVALSVVLLMAAGLMIRSMLYAENMRLGVNTENALTMRFDLPPSKYQGPQQQVSFFQELTARLESLPGVETAAIMSELPGSGPLITTPFQIEGSPIADMRDRPRTAMLTIGPGYFRCLQARLILGREFTELEGAPGHEAAIINQSFADRYWLGENPLGKRIRVDGRGTEAWATIVGVAADIVQNRYSEGLPRVYLPYRQNPGRYMVVAARTRVEPASLAPAFRQSVKDLDANLPVFGVRSLANHVSSTNADMRLFSAMFSVLAVIALALASMGLYAVISQSVNQRTREMAIRAVMGASGSRLWRLMFFQGMWQFTIGLVIGLALSFAVGGALSSLLVGVSAGDPVTYILVVSLLTIVAALACGLPARRAARSDPAAVLRFE